MNFVYQTLVRGFWIAVSVFLLTGNTVLSEANAGSDVCRKAIAAQKTAAAQLLALQKAASAAKLAKDTAIKAMIAAKTARLAYEKATGVMRTRLYQVYLSLKKKAEVLILVANQTKALANAALQRAKKAIQDWQTAKAQCIAARQKQPKKKSGGSRDKSRRYHVPAATPQQAPTSSFSSLSSLEREVGQLGFEIDM